MLFVGVKPFCFPFQIAYLKNTHMNINLSLNKFKIGHAWLSNLKGFAFIQHIYFPCGMQKCRIETATSIGVKRQVFNSNIFHILQLLNCHGKFIVFFINYAFLDFFQMFFLFLFSQKPIKHC